MPLASVISVNQSEKRTRASVAKTMSKLTTSVSGKRAQQMSGIPRFGARPSGTGNADKGGNAGYVIDEHVADPTKPRHVLARTPVKKSAGAARVDQNKENVISFNVAVEGAGAPLADSAIPTKSARAIRAEQRANARASTGDKAAQTRIPVAPPVATSTKTTTIASTAATRESTRTAGSKSSADSDLDALVDLGEFEMNDDVMKGLDEVKEDASTFNAKVEKEEKNEKEDSLILHRQRQAPKPSHRGVANLKREKVEVRRSGTEMKNMEAPVFTTASRAPSAKSPEEADEDGAEAEISIIPTSISPTRAVEDIDNHDEEATEKEERGTRQSKRGDIFSPPASKGQSIKEIASEGKKNGARRGAEERDESGFAPINLRDLGENTTEVSIVSAFGMEEPSSMPRPRHHQSMASSRAPSSPVYLRFYDDEKSKKEKKHSDSSIPVMDVEVECSPMSLLKKCASVNGSAPADTESEKASKEKGGEVKETALNPRAMRAIKLDSEEDGARTVSTPRRAPPVPTPAPAPAPTRAQREDETIAAAKQAPASTRQEETPSVPASSISPSTPVVHEVTHGVAARATTATAVDVLSETEAPVASTNMLAVVAKVLIALLLVALSYVIVFAV
uniref:Uncharacterized protein n=1 Tax=Palpitomonas bilix TaxID=652834 RepID=A0A7S3GDX5_9EUKA